MTRQRQQRQRRDVERVVLELSRSDTQDALLVYDAVRVEYARQLRQRRREQVAATTQPITQPARLRPNQAQSPIFVLALAEAAVFWEGVLKLIDAVGWLCCVTLPMALTRQQMFVYVDHGERLWVVYRHFGPPLVLGG